LPHIGEASIAHITARQELREMVAGLDIPGVGEAPRRAAAG
jgi:chromosome partitioning protein